MRVLFAAIAVIVAGGQSAHAASAALCFDSGVAQVRFAAGEIRRAFAARGTEAAEKGLDNINQGGDGTRIIIASSPAESRRIAAALKLAALNASDSQAYAIRKRGNTYIVLGAGANGAMYGGLDIAEAVRLGTLAEVKDAERVPHIAKRGVKLNIPLDARTPSYSDAGDSAQLNIPEMWSMSFWTGYLDEMARYRYNVLSLWSLHPFPSLVKVPEYPDVALSDVKRTTITFADKRHNGTGMTNPEIFSHLETVKRMSIEEKIKFWRDVMQYAHDRGIELYLFTWNIFTLGTDGKYGITSDQTNPTTIDYFRKSVRETILTYPLLAGIGVTAGENMPVKEGEFSKERWLWKTYGEGIRDALKVQPKRQFRLIHRMHQTTMKKLPEEWKTSPAIFEISYKNSYDHMYSHPAPPFGKEELLGTMPPGLRLWMSVRNDDIYSFRWGDPEYARAYIRNLPGPDKLIGFNMGADGYTWGREFISREPDTPRELVISKQWYSFMLWGRLSFDLSLPDSLFERTLASRFPEVPGSKLYAASSYASRIIPRVNTFYWRRIDIRWFPEGCTAYLDDAGYQGDFGFADVKQFMNGSSMPGSGVASIPEYLNAVLDGQRTAAMTPLQAAAELKSNAAKALQLVAEMRLVKSKELRFTLGDYEAMAHLGNYYAEKILGATDLAFFDRTGKLEQKESAVRHLRAAMEHWKKYAATATGQYKPQRLQRIGYFDLNQLASNVKQDIATAEAWTSAAAQSSRTASALLCFSSSSPAVRFAAAEIRKALESKGTTVTEKSLSAIAQPVDGIRIVLASSADEERSVRTGLNVPPLNASDAQAYAIRRRGNTYIVLGGGEPGAMYGGLDLAEAVRLGTLTEVKDAQRVPHIAKRGIKFNIPLDARTPSYSDAGDSAQQNIPEMWSMSFWTEFLDEMARDRYNVLSLWSLNPFPSLVKVPEYPDVALADVKRTTVRFEDQRHNGTNMGSPEIFAHLETVKKMSIEEKIKFWRDVMQYAHDRGIEVYLFTWNVFTFGEAGKYGITSDQTNTTTIDYFRKSVREAILTYPLLAGIGVTAGENMPVKDGEFSKEKWLWKTYGEGIRDALKLQPKRQFRLIHRQHQTSLKTILNEWKDLPGTFEMSYKYSVAHMYSHPAPPFAKKDILDEMPASLRVWMTVRNDDIYSFRWGDPEYARAYIRNLPGPDKMTGFYMGPDGYTWGREFMSREPETPRELVIKKQWYSFMLWGRLSFDPSLPDALFERMLATRFPEVPSAKLYAASLHASRIIPRATTFNWGPIDIRWFPEACSAHAKLGGFYSLERFMKGQSMPGAGVLSIPDYLKTVLDGQPMEGMTPLQAAAELKSNAAKALELVSEMRPVKSKELRYTLGDYEAMAHLGNYYAEKILGSTDLALFDRTGKVQQKESAVKHLRAALEHWKKYAAAATAQYKPQLLTRLGYFDLNQITPKVEKDLATAEAWQRH